MDDPTFTPRRRTAPAVEMLRFSTDDFLAHQRIDAYREIYGRLIVKHDVQPLDPQFHFKAFLLGFPNLGLSLSDTAACRRVHRPKHIESDDFGLGISLDGEYAIEQRGRQTIVRPGEAVLLSSADTGEVTTVAASRSISLRIPRSVLSHIDPSPPLAIPATNEGLRLLIGYIGLLRDAEVQNDPALCDATVAHIHDLVRLAVGARGDAHLLAQQGGGRAARRVAILRTIKVRSGDPSLSPTSVAALLGVSPRYVHLLLEETGKSFSQHLGERRLEKTAALLHDPRWSDRNISEIAFEAGFTDLSHFSRAFRRHYGMTASEMRLSAHRANDGRDRS